jgi:DNA-binding response OmpR family regulator
MQAEMNADATASGDPAVLVAHEEVAAMRLIRDSLLGFMRCEVDSCLTGESAFERCLQRRYRLLFLSLHLPILSGELVYELVGKVYHYGHLAAHGRMAPPVIFVGETGDRSRAEELARDARVKGVLLKPLRIDRILERAKLVLEEKAVG